MKLPVPTAIFTMLAVACLLLTGCQMIPILQLTSPKIIYGSGNVVTEPRMVRGFNTISLNGRGQLIIEQTGVESLSIMAEDNILPALTSAVRDNRLILETKRNTRIEPTTEIIYQLTVKDFIGIEINGSGNVDATAINTDRLRISVNGAGNLTLAGTADLQEILLSGSGNYFGANLLGKEVTVNISGSGKVVVRVSDSLNVQVSGSGTVEYIGNPTLNMNISGTGSVQKL